jgi:GNAT superfamily N-acetyltransferase
MIRRLRQNDAEALDDFLRHGLSSESKRYFGAHQPDVQSCQDVCKAIGTDGTVRIVATNDDQIIGYLILAPLRQKEIDHYTGYGRPDLVENALMLAPAVADRFHGRGIGRELVEYAVSIANELSVDTIVLWGGAHDGNTKGRRLYERTGFSYIGIFDRPEEGTFSHDMARLTKGGAE